MFKTGNFHFVIGCIGIAVSGFGEIFNLLPPERTTLLGFFSVILAFCIAPILMGIAETQDMLKEISARIGKN
jgi:hypothetical protein